jgi:hypothetical protein
MSVGRISETDVAIDCEYFGVMTEKAINRLTYPRFNKMHQNHRPGNEPVSVNSEVMTGFILRSELVGKWKGLETFGYNDKKEILTVLRMESLSSEILICIFNGELSNFIISEPKTGLRFGAPDNTGKITLRDMSDTDNFGKPLDGKEVNLNNFTATNGRLSAAALAKEFAGQLKEPILSSQFAFQLIAVAKRAEFQKGGV